jgi:hypothetical protein
MLDNSIIALYKMPLSWRHGRYATKNKKRQAFYCSKIRLPDHKKLHKVKIMQWIQSRFHWNAR